MRPGKVGIMTDKGRLARVVDVQQVTVQVHVLFASNLDGCIRSRFSYVTRGECHLGEQAEGRKSDFGEALRGELGLVNDDFLDLGIGRPSPMRRERAHFSGGSWHFGGQSEESRSSIRSSRCITEVRTMSTLLREFVSSSKRLERRKARTTGFYGNQCD
jgi:hypothetical protein